MQGQWTLQDAKNKFSEVVNAACDGNPQVVTKRGVPSVVVLSVDTYEQLVSRGKSSSSNFMDFLLAMPKTEEEEDIPPLEIKLRDVEF